MKREASAFIVSLLGCCALIGCYPSAARLAPPSPNRPWQPVVTAIGTLPRFELPPHVVPPYLNAAVPCDTDYVYTLPELIDLAQRSNPDTRIAWEQAKQAALAVGLAQANYLPQICASVMGGYQHTPLPAPKIVNPAGHLIFDTAEVLPALVIKWLLFDFGKRDCVVEAATQLSYAANIAFTETHQRLIFEVSKAYFALDAVRAQLHVAEDALKKAEILQDAAEAKFERGLETKTEVAIARRETAKARYDLEQAKADDNDAYHGLMEAMGLNPMLDLQIADNSGSDLPPVLAADVNTYICHALEQRPDIIEAFAKLRASSADVCSAEASFRPTIELDGILYQNIMALSINNGPIARINTPASAFLVKFSLPLYDGGMRRNTLSIARSKKAVAREQLVKTQDEAIRQVAKAYDTVKSALAEYDSANALVEASSIAYYSALDSYKQGVGTFTNAVTTNTELAHAQYVQAQAYASALTAAAALAFSAGELTSIDALSNPYMGKRL